MSLQKTETFTGKSMVQVAGVSVPMGDVTVSKPILYRVARIDGTKHSIRIRISIVDITDGPEIDQTEVIMDGDALVKMAYLHIKTLPEFEGAVDC